METQYAKPFVRRAFERHLSDGRTIPVTGTIVTNLPARYSKSASGNIIDFSKKFVPGTTKPIDMSLLIEKPNAVHHVQRISTSPSGKAIIIAFALVTGTILTSWVVHRHNEKKKIRASNLEKEDAKRKEYTKMEDCINCQQPLKGGGLTLPWEDEDNAYAYVTCPHCGHENIKEGFGGDD
jgi:DNA-directed RNA polymerase subunit RPC12/RpoP